MYHYCFQEGYIPELPGTFGAGQRIETDEKHQEVLSIQPLIPTGESSEETEDREEVSVE